MSGDDRPDGADVDPELLTHVDESKRSSLRKLVIGTAYAVPAIASFALTGLSVNEAHAYTSNVSGNSSGVVTTIAVDTILVNPNP
jgi:hypothetical protein